METIIINSKTHGIHEVFVDDEDFERVNKYTWHIAYDRGILYANNNIIGKLHRFIMGCKKGDGKIIDHKDHNGLNCKKENLRDVTHSQNMINRSSKKNSTSKYLGVHWYKLSNKWRAEILYKSKKNQKTYSEVCTLIDKVITHAINKN